MIAAAATATLGPRTLVAVRQFQGYVRDCVGRRAASWPHAKPLIQQIADEIHEDCGAQPLPVSLSAIVAMFRVSLRIAEPTSSRGAAKIAPIRGGFEATIFRSSDGPNDSAHPSFDLEAVIASAPTREGNRTRFTVAHELGHTLFYARENESSYPTRIVAQPASFEQARWREEGLCHDFARALLIPKNTRSLISNTPHMGVLVDLVRAARVTPEPLVRRIMYDWDLWPDAVLTQLTVSDGRLHAKLFRGANRRASTGSGMTAPRIEKELMGVHTLAEAEAVLVEKKLLKNQLTMRGTQALWGVLAR
jgi:hypothetical protein